MSATAYHQGFSEGYVYDACIPPLDAKSRPDYIEGYGDAMDVNIQINGGICYQTEWEKDDIASSKQEPFLPTN